LPKPSHVLSNPANEPTAVTQPGPPDDKNVNRPKKLDRPKKKRKRNDNDDVKLKKIVSRSV
jgi:hypothetical protein